MNAPQFADLDMSNLKEVASCLVEPLREYSATAERERNVPRESIKLLIDSGLLQLLQPASHGGLQMNLRSHVDVVSTIAEGCHATAWVLGVAHAHSWMLGHMSKQALDDVYGDNDNQLVAAVIGPRGKAIKQEDGSYVLSGFWPFASGNAHAKWMLLGAKVFNLADEQVDEGDLLVPADDIQRLDDWHVAGLQGTGSNSVKCSDVSVPAHRFLCLPEVMNNASEAFKDPKAPALYKAQGAPVFNICIASSCTGIARSALKEFLKIIPAKPVMYTEHITDQWTPIQQAIGEASAAIHAAELIMYRVADDIDSYSSRGEAMPIELRGRIRMDLAMAPRMCRDAVQKLFSVGGAAGLSLRSPIQLAVRNLQAITMHGALMESSCAEAYGRILLGQEPGTPVI